VGGARFRFIFSGIGTWFLRDFVAVKLPSATEVFYGVDDGALRPPFG